MLEKTKEGLLIRPAGQVAPLKEWDKLFTAADTTPEKDFNDWDIGILSLLFSDAHICFHHTYLELSAYSAFGFHFNSVNFFLRSRK